MISTIINDLSSFVVNVCSLFWITLREFGIRPRCIEKIIILIWAQVNTDTLKYSSESTIFLFSPKGKEFELLFR